MRHIEVNPLQLEVLRLAYPGIDIEAHLARMESWLYANPRRRPRNQARFIANWLNRHIPIEQASEAQVGTGPTSGFYCRGCKATFTTHAKLCSHVCGCEGSR